MRLIKWFLKFFQPTVKMPRRVKFLEGTEWLCPECEVTIAVARRDIHAGDVAKSSDWDIKNAGFWTRTHCGEHLFHYDAGGRGILIHTPTGWVG